MTNFPASDQRTDLFKVEPGSVSTTATPAIELLQIADSSGEGAAKSAPALHKQNSPHVRWIGAVVAVLVVGGAIYGVPALMRAVEHRNAVEVFEVAVIDRVAAYDAQDEVVEQLHAAEAALTADYPLYVAIANTLTDSTVNDPATRVDLLVKATEYAKTDLALDGAGVFVIDRPAVFDALVLERLVPAEASSVSDFSAEDLRSQASVLAKDTKLTLSYIDLVEDVTDTITAAAAAAADSADAVIASAAEKGVTLTWEKAPAETAAVTSAAAALATDDALGLVLADRTGLVDAYIAAVKAAGAAHQAVIDQEAEAARRAAAEEAKRQAAAQRQQQHNNNGGGGNPSSRGSTDGGSKNGGGGNPGSSMSGGLPGYQSGCDGCLKDKNVWE